MVSRVRGGLLHIYVFMYESSFCGITATPLHILDFGRFSPWISKPGTVACRLASCICRVTSDFTPLDQNGKSVILVGRPTGHLSCQIVRTPGLPDSHDTIFQDHFSFDLISPGSLYHLNTYNLCTIARSQFEAYNYVRFKIVLLISLLFY